MKRLVVFSGLPGVGKSALAEIVARRLDAVWLRVDTVEAAILKASIRRTFASGLAAYLAVHDIARENIRVGHSVVIDAVNGVQEARDMWRALARSSRTPLRIVEVVCSDSEEHRRRVESRASATPPLPTPTWAEVVHREYRQWKEPILRVDGCLPVPENVRRVLNYCD